MKHTENHAEGELSSVAGKQLRAARGALNWSVRCLSEKSGVGAATITRYEAVDGVPHSRKGNLTKLRSVLEAQGIRFVSDRKMAFGLLFDISVD
ncbi:MULTISPECIES: helix-turn-helix transcriptional regulator [unclassified Ruegeria]|uniref:helix-turn-helix transcriptional regulator n=1 Tax=unclassified Ruegeria TaxID=2625375 RepID=UPI001489ADC3|nr:MULTISPECIES: helix-turn-helix transcriptional regulator [unclassified Ruegeria]